MARRDPFLPAPAVCDWLLSLEWSKPFTVHVRSRHHRGHTMDCCEASAAIGADGMIDLQLPTVELQILQQDAESRQADAYEASDLTPEQQLVVTINEALASSGVSATAAVGALTMAAIALTSQVYDLHLNPDHQRQHQQ